MVSAPDVGTPIPPELWDAVVQAGDDPQPSLVFADWLQQQGHPWGELIAVSHQLEEDPGNPTLVATHNALLKKLGWVTPFKPEDLRLNWRRGFVRHVHVHDHLNMDVQVHRTAPTLAEWPALALLESFAVFRWWPDEKDGMDVARQCFPNATVTVEIRHDGGTTPREDVRWLESDQLPAKIEEYTSLCRLHSHKLSAKLAKLPIEALDISNSYSMRSIPDAVWGIESLGHISMRDCDSLKLNMGQVNTMLAGFIQNQTSSAQRIVEATLLQGKPNKATVPQLMLALDSNVTAVCNGAIAALPKLLPKPLQHNPIGPGSVVAICGKLNLDRKQLKADLEAQGAKVATRINKATTHVVLGIRPKGQQHLVGDRTLVLEPHLVASAQPVEGGVDEAKLAQQLRSKDDQQITDAVGQLQALGAIPEAILPELFCVLQDTKLKGKGRTKAKALFMALAPAKLKKVVAQHFKTSVLLAGESKRNHRLSLLAKAKVIDVNRLARIFVDDHQCGYTFMFGLGHEERLVALNQLWVEGPENLNEWHTPHDGPLLDLSRLELDALPDLTGLDGLTALDVSYNHLTKFPEGLPTSVTHLNLRENHLRSLPRSLSHLTELREICLAYNAFNRFPKGALTVPNLVSLNLNSETYGETRITEIPPEIHKVADTLRFLRINNGKEAVSVPPELARLALLEELQITWKGTNEDLPVELRNLVPPDCKIH